MSQTDLILVRLPFLGKHLAASLRTTTNQYEPQCHKMSHDNQSSYRHAKLAKSPPEWAVSKERAYFFNACRILQIPYQL